MKKEVTSNYYLFWLKGFIAGAVSMNKEKALNKDQVECIMSALEHAILAIRETEKKSGE
tara:strand:- start:135 stop:311 length:177 start_codon:yes stop_codon:yes gene_type:complete